MSDLVSDGRLVAEHKFGWRRNEIVAIIALPIIAVAFNAFIFSGFALSRPGWWLIPVLSAAGSVGLIFLGRARKNESALQLRDENGVWRLYRGGVCGDVRGSRVDWASVTSVGVTKDEYTGVRELVLNSVDASGMSSGSLALPVRLLQASESLREELRAKMSGDVNVSDSARAMLADAAPSTVGGRML